MSPSTPDQEPEDILTPREEVVILVPVKGKVQENPECQSRFSGSEDKEF